jgi:hypothetical protein
MKLQVLSFIIKTASGEKRRIEKYPELQKLIDDGWEYMEALPPYGTGSHYVLSFVMKKNGEEKMMEELKEFIKPVKRKKRSRKKRS